MHETLKSAIAMHQSGRLEAAAPLYQRAIERDPNDSEALHLFGVLSHQQGAHARAIELISKAVALRPNSAFFHANLAEAYRAIGDMDRAIGCSQTALQLWPDYPEALCNLGAAQQGKGKHSDAIEHFRRAIELRPDFVVAHNNLGIALRETGQSDEALAEFQKAVELSPDFAPARTNLGQFLLDRGQPDEALPHCQEAVRLQPGLAALHHNLGNVLRRLERWVDARAAYLEALRLQPDMAITHSHMGLVLQAEGQLKDALVWTKKAVELDAGNVNFWQQLAELHGELEEPDLAIPCWQRVIELGPERAGAHVSLGWALQEESRFEEARHHYQHAAKLEPKSAVVQFNLGGLYEELGEMTAAENAFRGALQLQPSYPLPHARLATLLRGKLSTEDQTALESRLQEENLGKGPRARLLFALAHVLDARGEHQRVAECLRESNAISLEIGKGRSNYSAADHQQFVDGLIKVFNQPFFARLAQTGRDSRRPVFVFGLPRSGTTLIEQVLASHSRIHGAGELRLGRSSFESIPGVVGCPGPPRDAVALLDGTSLARLAEQHLERLAAIANTDAPRVVDKMPDNYMYLGLLAAMFPHATFIHCRRDLRDIAVSCWMTDFRSIRWANSFEHIAGRFTQYCKLWDHWPSVLDVPIHEVDYEDTVADLEGVSRRLVAACGSGMGASLPRVLQSGSAGAHGQPDPSAPAGLQAFGRTLAKLHGLARRTVRRVAGQRAATRFRGYGNREAHVKDPSRVCLTV